MPVVTRTGPARCRAAWCCLSVKQEVGTFIWSFFILHATSVGTLHFLRSVVHAVFQNEWGSAGRTGQYDRMSLTSLAHQVKSKQVGFAASVPPQHCHSCSKAEVLAAAVQIFRSIFAEQPELPGSHSRCPKHQRCAEAAGELCFCKADPGWLMVSIPNAWSGEKCPAPSPWGCTQQPPRCPGMA